MPAFGAVASATTEPPTTDAPTASGDTSAPPDATGPEQQVAETSGDLCTYEDYAGGVEQVDLATATIGFAQSEREANPFRIAETQSIRDEAEARGIELIVMYLGEDTARAILEQDEFIAGDTPTAQWNAPRMMDILNDEVGIEIGLAMEVDLSDEHPFLLGWSVLMWVPLARVEANRSC